MMNMLKACYDWRVLTALAAVGIGVFLWAPNLIGAALPLLLVAACPLSMMLMMKTMGGPEPSGQPAVAANPVDRAERLRAELAASRREQQRLVRELEDIEADPPATVAAKSTSSPPA